MSFYQSCCRHELSISSALQKQVGTKDARDYRHPAKKRRTTVNSLYSAGSVGVIGGQPP